MDLPLVLWRMGQLGQQGRRPRILEAQVVGSPAADGTYAITKLRGSNVVIRGIVAVGVKPGPNARVGIQAIAGDHTIISILG